MTDRIPAELRNRSSRPTPSAGGGSSETASAKILAAGMSVAAGVGLVGAMVAASTSQPAATAPPSQRIIVIERPVSQPDQLPQAGSEPAPLSIVLEHVPAPEPVTESEGS